jgi:hypothetical protein
MSIVRNVFTQIHLAQSKIIILKKIFQITKTLKSPLYFYRKKIRYLYLQNFILKKVSAKFTID